MLIKNNEARILGIPKKGSNGSVVLLKPGINDVKAEDFALIDDSDMFLLWLDAEMVELILPKREIPCETEDSNTFEISAINLKEAESIIEQTFDVDLLHNWVDEDTRIGVKKAIRKQLERIDNAGKRLDDEV